MPFTRFDCKFLRFERNETPPITQLFVSVSVSACPLMFNVVFDICSSEREGERVGEVWLVLASRVIFYRIMSYVSCLISVGWLVMVRRRGRNAVLCCACWLHLHLQLSAGSALEFDG
ncbi:hypothetical protein BO71DRAFT_95029 [Aspergillus ellipticus CBS 707.79]|uniref:Transmembrane protein n=1 Tax=Aspergillus ellipticus CBS 707.79 TaxID=1448320 RepID=A0A319CYU9_9EURO|nr:hypothetical protein BO71DRAFT_95029 [Aspergillus ellipticus CBS 707.79]